MMQMASPLTLIRLKREPFVEIYAVAPTAHQSDRAGKAVGARDMMLLSGAMADAEAGRHSTRNLSGR
ncbi:hypothetical protein DSD19_13990 [Rhodovulum sp. BSW8]|nr:hypothetical protein DSD19_13990 [Rhodovulum sp. BSW8]